MPSQNLMSSHYNTSMPNGNAYDDTEEGPLNAKSNMNEYSFVNTSQMNSNHVTDHPFNQTNKTFLIEEQLQQQQAPSIWR